MSKKSCALMLAPIVLSAWATFSHAGASENPTECPVTFDCDPGGNGTIPEPTTMLLMAAGVGGAALARKLRKGK